MSNGRKWSSAFFDRLVSESVRKIEKATEEFAENKAALMEAYVKEHLAKTGHKIEDLTIVQEIKSDKALTYLALKSEVNATVK